MREEQLYSILKSDVRRAVRKKKNAVEHGRMVNLREGLEAREVESEATVMEKVSGCGYEYRENRVINAR